MWLQQNFMQQIFTITNLALIAEKIHSITHKMQDEK